MSERVLDRKHTQPAPTVQIRDLESWSGSEGSAGPRGLRVVTGDDWEWFRARFHRLSDLRALTCCAEGGFGTLTVCWTLMGSDNSQYSVKSTLWPVLKKTCPRQYERAVTSGVGLTHTAKDVSRVTRKAFQSSNLLTALSYWSIQSHTTTATEKHGLEMELAEASHCSRICSKLF